MRIRLRVDAVDKFYGTDEARVRAVDGVSLTVGAGEMVALRGASGCGKSTLLSIAGGLLPPDSGSVHVDGENVYELREPQRQRLRRRSIGFIFQDYNLMRTLTAVENVMLVDELDVDDGRTGPSGSLCRAERVGLGDHRDRYPAELSGGQQQRVAVARALCGTPRLILADEPTGALDSVNADGVVELLRGLTGEGGGCLVVTHNDAVAAVADRVHDIRDGRIVASSEVARA